MYVHANQPSPLVLFTGGPGKKSDKSEPLTFRGFGDVPKHDVPSIANVNLETKKPFDLMQAEGTLALAERMEVDKSEPGLYRQAFVALGQAKGYATKSMSRSEVKEYARKSTTDSNEGIRMTLQRREAEALAAAIAARKAEMAQLEERARASEALAVKTREAMLEAESKLKQVQAQRTEVEAALASLRRNQMELTEQMGQLRQEKIELQASKEAVEKEKAEMSEQLQNVLGDVSKAQADMVSLREEKRAAEVEMAKLAEEKEALLVSKAALEKEKSELSGRLQSALSEVAETRDTARGFVVNLPDILFDLNKAELRHEAQLVMSKLAGILLMMPELQIRVEGHTDSSGSDAYNQELSERRANSVKALLIAQGVGPERVSSLGYGESKPIADNATADGRKANRRVEIIIKEGKIGD